VRDPPCLVKGDGEDRRKAGAPWSFRNRAEGSAMMADPTKLPHQDDPENPNEDLSDERQRKKAKVESGDEPEPPNDRKKRAGTPGRPASSGRHR